ncbi:MAG: cobalamin-dependent protein [Anaerolineae bacterium]|nr:cobalamin-dependent protein [Anaerolineae bacterium]
MKNIGRARKPSPRRPSRRSRDAQVLYIHPAKQDVDVDPRQNAMMGRPYALIPVGVAALVNVLRQEGIRVVGINLPMENRLDPAFDLRSWLQRHRSARMILIDMHWYEHVYGAISVARACKETLPQAVVVIGGLSASGFAHEILGHFREVDFVIRGDAEKPLLALALRLLRSGGELDLTAVPNLVYRDGTEIVENELAYCAATGDLDALNFVDIDFLEHADAYYIHEYIVTDLEIARSTQDKSRFRGKWLCNARGCKYNCSYCGGCRHAHTTLAGRSGIVPRSPQSMIEDLKQLAQQRVIQASLTYDLFELGETYWRTFFELLRDSGVKIGLYNELFQLPNAAFIEDYAQSVDMAQSCVALSPLSGSEAVRRLNGKHYDNKGLFRILDVLGRRRFPIFVYFSLNLPGEDEDTVHESIELAKAIYDFYPRSLLKILTSYHTIDPLCPMNTDPDKYGIQVDMSSFMDYYAYCRDTQLALPISHTGVRRGFEPAGSRGRSLEAMASMWDEMRIGREQSWWPVPPGW